MTEDEDAWMAEIVYPVKFVTPRIDQAKLRVPQGPDSGMAAIIGKWPGDETEEEITVILEAFTDRRGKPLAKAAREESSMANYEGEVSYALAQWSYKAQAKLDKVFALVEAHRTEQHYRKSHADLRLWEAVLGMKDGE